MDLPHFQTAQFSITSKSKRVKINFWQRFILIIKLRQLGKMDLFTRLLILFFLEENDDATWLKLKFFGSF